MKVYCLLGKVIDSNKDVTITFNLYKDKDLVYKKFNEIRNNIKSNHQLSIDSSDYFSYSIDNWIYYYEIIEKEILDKLDG